MNKNYTILVLSAITVGSLAFTKISKDEILSKYNAKFSHVKNSGGAPSGKSGAPGESNCTDCHSGTVQDGTGINELGLLNSNQDFVTEYTPGETYTVAISTESATKRGFQASPRIVSSNAMAGTSTGIAFVSNVQNANNQQYINHNSSSNTLPNGWLFTWTAPATDVGDVRFYLATNVTNSNNANSGDVIRTSQHTFSPAQSSASLKEEAKNIDLAVGYLSQSQSLLLNFTSLFEGSGYINLIDMSGKSVFSKRINSVKIGANEETVELPKNLNEGLYVVNFFVNNNSVKKKIMITK